MTLSPLYKTSLLTAILCSSSVALAHTPYILPFHFDTKKDVATIQASATEDLFIPDHGITGDFTVISPAGTKSNITDATTLKEVTLVQVPLADNGTYRITLNAKPRVSKYTNINGRWLSVRPARPDGSLPKEALSDRGYALPSELSKDAKLVESTSTRTLETFVTKGASSDKALTPTGKGLEIKFTDNPSEIYVDKGLAFDILFDGKPVKNQVVQIEQPGKAPIELTSDEKGHVKATFTQAGTYLLEATYPNDPEAHNENGRKTQPKANSFNYGLTFAVSQ
ncbi:DUF4198 domain-containing protein [Aquirhabdus sp.]|uniref:DUF4198 domain-containing protein n=1 Tax=Aquirhabdus sp. TaxID=2824160 RepID=UPI00396CB386